MHEESEESVSFLYLISTVAANHQFACTMFIIVTHKAQFKLLYILTIMYKQLTTLYAILGDAPLYYLAAAVAPTAVAYLARGAAPTAADIVVEANIGPFDHAHDVDKPLGIAVACRVGMHRAQAQAYHRGSLGYWIFCCHRMVAEQQGLHLGANSAVQKEELMYSIQRQGQLDWVALQMLWVRWATNFELVGRQALCALTAGHLD